MQSQLWAFWADCWGCSSARKAAAVHSWAFFMPSVRVCPQAAELWFSTTECWAWWRMKWCCLWQLRPDKIRFAWRGENGNQIILRSIKRCLLSKQMHSSCLGTRLAFTKGQTVQCWIKTPYFMPRAGLSINIFTVSLWVSEGAAH